MFKEGKSIVPVKTIKNAVMKGRRINPRELSSSLSAFCDDFVSYEAIQINDQKLFPTKRSEKNGKSTVVCKSSSVIFLASIFNNSS